MSELDFHFEFLVGVPHLEEEIHSIQPAKFRLPLLKRASVEVAVPLKRQTKLDMLIGKWSK